jgi:ribosome-binding factor A
MGEAVRHALSEILRKEPFHHSVLATTSVTISEVRMSADLKQATVYTLPLGGDQTEAVLEALGKAAPYLRRLLVSYLDVKITPNLHFREDRSFDTATHIETLLHDPRVKRDIGS